MKTIVLSGCPLALPSLQYLSETGRLTALICPAASCADDKAPLEQWAGETGVPCWSIGEGELEKDLTELISETQPGLVLVFGFPYSLPAAFLETARPRCWNMHFSLQPERVGTVTLYALAQGREARHLQEESITITSDPAAASPLNQLSLQAVSLLKTGLSQVRAESYIERYFSSCA
ncbi:MAG TPA: hypothetical protein VHK69_04995 [Chitinophagaceae bacterium]|jgi:methionyl-tRNA formyltransferase|nr:hypothetical protein [Chitinophagaceae bacterium]